MEVNPRVRSQEVRANPVLQEAMVEHHQVGVGEHREVMPDLLVVQGLVVEVEVSNQASLVMVSVATVLGNLENKY